MQLCGFRRHVEVVNRVYEIKIRKVKGASG